MRRLPDYLPLVHLLRHVAMLGLLLVVIGNPALAAVGDTYEAARGTSGHLDYLHDGPDCSDIPQTGQAAAASDGEDPGLTDLLDALAHSAHCCGHLSAVLPGPLLALAFIGGAAAPLASLPPPATTRPATLIRPPILI